MLVARHLNNGLPVHNKLRDCHSTQKYAVELATKHMELECGPMPNVMAALPNIGGALCSTPQSLPARAHYYSAVQ